MAELSQNIRSLRVQAQMTQDELAARLCVTRQAVSNWETGKTQPDVETLQRLSEVFATDIGGLLGGEARPAPKRNTRRCRIWFLCLLPLALAALFGMNSLVRYLKAYSAHTYDMLPSALYYLFARPLLYALITVTALLGLSLLADISLASPRARHILLIAGVALALLLLTATPLWWFFSEGVANPPVWLFRLISRVIGIPAIYSLLTVCIFLGLNKRHAE